MPGYAFEPDALCLYNLCAAQSGLGAGDALVSRCVAAAAEARAPLYLTVLKRGVAPDVATRLEANRAFLVSYYQRRRFRTVHDAPSDRYVLMRHYAPTPTLSASCARVAAAVLAHARRAVAE